MITKIHNLINNFIQQYNIHPTELWIGQKEKQELYKYIRDKKAYIYEPFKEHHPTDGKDKIAGLTLRFADSTSCFRVGITVN